MRKGVGSRGCTWVGASALLSSSRRETGMCVCGGGVPHSLPFLGPVIHGFAFCVTGGEAR